MSVTLYTQPGCNPCKLTKMQLQKLDIDFNIVDVREDEEALIFVQSLGYQSVPVTVLEDGQHWDGYRPDRLRALVA